MYPVSTFILSLVPRYPNETGTT